ncbi:MAG: hypothetical protein ABI649_00030 [Gaiellaceae bacterium]
MTTGLTRLDELADVRLGVKTFLNPFFYVDEERVNTFQIEPQFLESVFRTSDAKRDRFLQSVSSTHLRIFLCDQAVENFVGTGAAAYIKWGAKQRHKTSGGEVGGYWKDTPAVKPKERLWYQNQAMPPPARIALLKAFDEYFAPFILDEPVRVDQRFNQVNARPGVGEELLIGLLCSMWFVMLCETFGATSMGQGALEVRTEVLRGLQVPDIRKLDPTLAAEWRTATAALLEGERLPASKGQKNDKQRALDSCVLRAVGLGDERLTELYDDTLRMGSIRHLLAAGRGEIKRERFVTNLGEVATDIAAQLRPALGGRRFPADFLPSGAKTRTVQFGNAPLSVRSEQLMGQRRLTVMASENVVYEDDLPAATGELIIRALELRQRSIRVPEDEGAAEAALVALELLTRQLDTKLRDLVSTAGAPHQAALREQAEAELNFPVSTLSQPIAAVYEAEV